MKPKVLFTVSVILTHVVHIPILPTGGQVHSPVLQVWCGSAQAGLPRELCNALYTLDTRI
jgi:hypothetical protein